MSGPADLPPQGDPPSSGAVPDPVRAGRGQVRPLAVLAGFGIAAAAGIGFVSLAWWWIGTQYQGWSGLGPALLAPVFPFVGLLAVTWVAARRGHKGIAVGVAIFLGLSALAVTACFGTFANF